MKEDQIRLNLPPRRLLGWSAAAIGLGSLIFVGLVLPAEWGRDPTGFGKASGLNRLWAPDEVAAPATSGAAAPPAAHSSATPFRQDVVRIPLAPSGDSERGDELEYKVRMRKGDMLTYSWSVPDLPAAASEEFYTEFHGHTVAVGQTMTVSEYRKEAGSRDQGALIAPFDGVHGWYVQNQSVGPVAMELHLAGFYTLVPPGEVGNEAGIVAQPVR